MIAELHEVYRDIAMKVHLPLFYYMAPMLQGLPNPSLLVKQLFFNHMHLFDFKPWDRRQYWKYSAKKIEERLFSRSPKLPQPQKVSSTPPTALFGNDNPDFDLKERCPKQKPRKIHLFQNVSGEESGTNLTQKEKTAYRLQG